MNDIISREAAIMAAINADMENNAGILIEKNARVIEEHLSILPAIDVVPVVRCKDCKHLDKHGCCKRLAGAGFWDPAAFAVDDEDYCSRGERRSDAED